MQSILKVYLGSNEYKPEMGENFKLRDYNTEIIFTLDNQN
jgi:hypothetical protein